jgi:hypothetical protein
LIGIVEKLPNYDWLMFKITGFDAIIGRILGGDDEPAQRALSGTDPNGPNDPNAELLTRSEQWVVPQGGEYFFSPSLSTLTNTFALAA